jgi:DNA-binding NarL/FixJ family response regulator
MGTLARADILLSDPPLGFTHPLIHEAVLRDVPAAERELRHARAARLLADRNAAPDEIAAHLLMAPRNGEGWVAELLQKAGQAAMRQGAPDSAIAYLRRAIDEPAPDDMRPDLLYELGMAEEAVSGPNALDTLKEARELATDPARRMELAFLIARTQLFVGAPDQSLATAQQAGAEIPPEMTDERMMFEAFEYALIWFGVGDPARLVGLIPYREAPPQGDGPGARMLTVVAALGWVYDNGPSQACADLALRAISDGVLFEAEGNMSPGMAGGVLTFAEYPNILAFWDDRMADAHRVGSMFAKLTSHLWRSLSLLRHGDLTDVERDIAAGIEGQRLWGLTIASGASHTFGILASSFTERGMLEQARQALESVPPEDAATYGSLTWRRAKVELLLAERDFEGALAAVADLQTPLTDAPVLAPWRTLRALALDGLGGDERRAEAIELAAEEVALAREAGAPAPTGRALRILGTLKRDQGLDDLRDAVQLLESSNARLERAKALHALGVALRLARRPSDAREPLRRALELAAACDADGLAEDIRSELAATGARPRTAALGGVEALTASERRVTGLAAEGRTNKDIAQELYVTPKTVEVHLSNAYRKLGIRSRHELAEALA